MEYRAEVLPLICYDGKAVGTVGLEGAYTAVVEAEVDELAAQSRAQPQRPYPAFYLFEDEDAAPLLGMEARGLHYAYQGIEMAVAVDIAHAEAVDGIRQLPLVQMVEAVVRLGQVILLRPPSQQGLDFILNVAHLRRAFLQLVVAVDEEELGDLLHVIARQRLARRVRR